MSTKGNSATAEPGPWSPGLESTLPRRFLPLSTMFRPDNVTTGIEQAEGLGDFSGLSSFSLAAFRPERLVVHELLIRVTCDLSVPDGARYEDLGINFRRMTSRLLDGYVAPRLPEITVAFETLKRTAAARIRELFRAHLEPAAPAVPDPPPRSSRGIGAILRRWRASATQAPPAVRFAHAQSPQERDLEALAMWRRQAREAITPMDRAVLSAVADTAAAVIRRRGRLVGDVELLTSIAATLFGNAYGSAFVGALVDPLFREGVAAEGYRLLPVQRRAIVMNVKGASASGKSTMRPEQRQLASRLGVRWEDFALISPDIWRKFLLDYDALGEATRYAGTLTGHELEVIDRKLDRYMSNKAEQGRMTHLLIDRFRFDSFAADGDREDGSQLLTRFGHIVYLFFMITPPEATVERAWKRGLQFGRFKAVDDLLAHNVEAFTGMPRLYFTWAQSLRKIVHTEFLDNSVAEGELPRTVAFGIGGDLTILDVKLLLDVERYRKIIVTAHTPAEVYPPAAAMAPERNLQVFKDLIHKIPRVTLADHATGRVLVRLDRGRIVAWHPSARERLASDADFAAALAAAGGLPDRAPAAAELIDETLTPSAAETLGAWGAGRARD